MGVGQRVPMGDTQLRPTPHAPPPPPRAKPAPAGSRRAAQGPEPMPTIWPNPTVLTTSTSGQPTAT